MRGPQGDDWKWVVVGAVGLLGVVVAADVITGTAHAVAGGGPGAPDGFVVLRQQLVKPPRHSTPATSRRRRRR